MSKYSRSVQVYNAVSKWLSGPGAAQTANVAKRIGMSSGVSAKRIADVAKQNKLTAAFVLFEMGTAGASLLADLSAEDSEVARLVEMFDTESDKVSETESVSDLPKFNNEFKWISDAIRVAGSFERLVNLKKALDLDYDTYKLYYAARETGRRLI